jgi:hypothetical protein
MVVYTYNPSYMGGIGMRIELQGSILGKKRKTYLKITKTKRKKKGWGMTQVVVCLSRP